MFEKFFEDEKCKVLPPLVGVLPRTGHIYWGLDTGAQSCWYSQQELQVYIKKRLCRYLA